MESVLKTACTIKIQNFEGPFDLLFHLIEKNKVNIYDIQINDITDQYMEYLFAMKELDLEIASEFVVMAATLLHIKSRIILPVKKKENENIEEEIDPREELIIKLIEYKKFKEVSKILKEREVENSKMFYKDQELIKFKWVAPPLNLCKDLLKSTYENILEKNRIKLNDTTMKMSHILKKEKVSLKDKMKDVIKNLFNRVSFIFADLFHMNKKSKIEVVTGFLAILELSKLKRVNIVQEKLFSDILIYKNDKTDETFENENNQIGYS